MPKWTIQPGGTWDEPPPAVRDAVNRAYGDDVYAMAAAAWTRATRAEPEVILHSWFRSPQKQAGLRRGARFSQHPLGTAVDVSLPEEQRQAAFVQALRSEGFYVIPEGSHLHVQFIQPRRFEGLLPALRAAGLYGAPR